MLQCEAQVILRIGKAVGLRNRGAKCLHCLRKPALRHQHPAPIRLHFFRRGHAAADGLAKVGQRKRAREFAQVALEYARRAGEGEFAAQIEKGLAILSRP